MAFCRGGMEYCCSLQNGWLIGQKPMEWQKVTSFYCFYILERDKNVNLCILKIKDKILNEVKKHDAWCVCYCQVRGRRICFQRVPAVQVLWVNLSIFFLSACWMKECIHLKYGRDRATHSFTSSFTPFNFKKVCIFDAKTRFLSFCFLPFVI